MSPQTLALPAWSDALEPLLRPLASVLDGALPSLELRPSASPPVRAGRAGALVAFEDGEILLDPELLVAGALRPADQVWADGAPEGLGALMPDRWRRAAGAVLEGLALAALAEDETQAATPLWWRAGRAVEAADRAAPMLGGLWPEAVDLLGRPEDGLEAQPRRAAWLFRWLRLRGQDLQDPGQVSESLLADFAAWTRNLRAGPSSLAPSPIPLAHAQPALSWTAAALSWRPVAVHAGPTGALLRARGGMLVGAALVGDSDAVLVVASRDAGAAALQVLAAGPLGTWSLATGKVQERVGAARGVDLVLREDGSLELVFADGFMGLPTADMLSLASEVGVSGLATGRFSVLSLADDGLSGAFRIDALVPQGLTLHPRKGRAFALPASAVLGPAERVLTSLAGVTFSFREREGDLILDGLILGNRVELRLRNSLMTAEAWA